MQSPAVPSSRLALSGTAPAIPSNPFTRRRRAHFIEALEARITPADIGDVLQLASLLSLSPGDTQVTDDEIGNNEFGASDVDLFRINLLAGDFVTADIDASETGLSSLDSVLRIFDAAGNQIIFNDDGTDPDTGAQTIDSAVSFTADSAGAYYIGVSGFSNFDYDPNTAGSEIGGSTGLYELRVSLDRLPVPDAGDTLGAARAISLQPGARQSLVDEIGNNAFGPGDVDFFRVSLLAGDIVTADIDASETGLSTLDGVLRVFNSAGQELDAIDDAADPETGAFTVDPALTFTADSAGVYYIGISSFANFSYDPNAAGSGTGGSTGTYQLLLDLERQVAAGDAGDVIAQARPLAVQDGTVQMASEEIGNNVFGAGDVDFFRVDLLAGDIVTLDIDASEIGLSGLDSVLRVFDGAGLEIAVSDDAADPETGLFTADSALTFTASLSGAYYVGVSSFANFSYNPFAAGSGTGGSTGAYQLRAALERPAGATDAGDILANARPFALQPGGVSTQNEEIGNNAFGSGDVDFFRVDLVAGDILTLDIDASEIGVSSLDSILRVFNAAGQEIAVSDDAADPDTGIFSADSALTFTASAAGAYYVGVSSFANFSYDPNTAGSGTGGSTGAYQLHAGLQRPAAAGDVGDTIATAMPVLLQAGGTRTQNAEIGNNTFGSGDVDFFRVDLLAGDILTLDIDASEIGVSSLDSILRVFNAAGQEIAVSDDAADPDTGIFSADSALTFTASAAGAYYVGVSSFANFSYDPNTAGSGTGGSTGAYQLHAGLQRPAAAGDVGDTIASAMPVLLQAGGTRTQNAEIGNNTFGSGDVDFFRVDLLAGDILTLDIDASEIGVSSLDSVLRVFNAAGQEIAVSDDAADPDTGVFGTDSALTFTASLSGAYYAGVSSFANFYYDPNAAGSGSGGSTGAYQLRAGLQRPAAAGDVGDTIATAMPVLLQAGGTRTQNAEIGNNAFGPGDVDFFRVDLLAGDVVTLDIDASEIALSGLDSILRVFTAEGQEIAVNDDGADPDTGAFSTDSALTFTAATAGSYYAGVSSFANFSYNPNVANSGAGGSTGTYQLHVHLDRAAAAVDVGDSIATAMPVLLQNGATRMLSEVLGNNGRATSDVDLYRIELQAGDVLGADIDAREINLSSLDSFLRLFSSAGQELAANDDANDPDSGVFSFDSAITYTIPVSGTYFVGVSAFSNSSYDPNTPGQGTGGSEGAYRLLLNLSRPAALGDVGDTLATAMPVLLQTGATRTINAEIGNNGFGSGDADLFRVELRAGQVLSADIDAREINVSQLDSVLRIFDSTGRQVSINDDAADPDTGVLSFDSAISFTAPANGTYFVGVSSFSNVNYNPNAAGTGTGNSSGAYRLLLGLRDSTPGQPPVAPPPTQSAQVVWLNFGGGSATDGWTYAQNVPAFNASDFGISGAQTQQFIDRIVQFVTDDFIASGSIENPGAALNLSITIARDFNPALPGDQPPAAGQFMTVFIGGAQDGLLGIAEGVDRGNRRLDDNARVYSSTISTVVPGNATFDDAAFALADTISHEMAHNIGLSHVQEDGFLLQTGALDLIRIDNERFGENGTLFHTPGTQNDIQLLQQNLRLTTDLQVIGAGIERIGLVLANGEEAVRNGDLSFSGDSTDFVLDVSSGDALQIDLDARELFGGRAQYRVSVLNSSGVEVDSSVFGVDPGTGFVEDPYLVVQNLAAGQYTLRVTALQFDGGDADNAFDGRFQLAVRKLSSDLFARMDQRADGENKAIVLDSKNRSHRFIDADGDVVKITLKGRGAATASILLGDDNGIGADIASIVAKNTDKKNKIIVQVVKPKGDNRAEIGSMIVDSDEIGAVKTKKANFRNLLVDGSVGSVSMTQGSVTGLLGIAKTAKKVKIMGGGASLTGSALFLGDTANLSIDEVGERASMSAFASVGKAKFKHLDNASFTAGGNVGKIKIKQASSGRFSVGGSLKGFSVGASFGPAFDSADLADEAEQTPSELTVGGELKSLKIRGDLTAGVFAGDGIAKRPKVNGDILAPVTGFDGVLRAHDRSGAGSGSPLADTVQQPGLIVLPPDPAAVHGVEIRPPAGAPGIDFLAQTLAPFGPYFLIGPHPVPVPASSSAVGIDEITRLVIGGNAAPLT